MKTKNALISDTAKEIKVPKHVCSVIINAFLEQLEKDVLSGERVVLHGLLTIDTVEYPERMGRDPVTGEVIQYPPSKSVRCKMSKQIKEMVRMS